MPEFTIQKTISAPISEVYAAVTDYENTEAMKQWQPDLQTLNVTAAKPLRTGSMIAMERKFMGSTIFVNADVVDYQRNKRFALRGIHGRFAFSREIEFSPSARETIVTDTVNLNVGWLYFWWSPFAGAALRKQLEQEWQRLATQLS